MGREGYKVVDGGVRGAEKAKKESNHRQPQHQESSSTHDEGRGPTQEDTLKEKKKKENEKPPKEPHGCHIRHQREVAKQAVLSAGSDEAVRSTRQNEAAEPHLPAMRQITWKPDRSTRALHALRPNRPSTENHGCACRWFDEALGECGEVRSA